MMDDPGALEGGDHCAATAKVLLVDDTPAQRLRLRGILSPSGYGLVEARSGEEALGVLRRSSQFAVILMDVGMPGLDGFETVRLIRKREALRRTPVIFLIAGRHERLAPLADVAGAGGKAGSRERTAVAVTNRRD